MPVPHQEWELGRVESLLESPFTEQPRWAEVAHLGRRLAEATQYWESLLKGGLGKHLAPSVTLQRISGT